MIKKILQTEPTERPKRKIQMLIEHFKSNKFLAETASTRDNETVLTLYRNLKLEECVEGEPVFRYGDRGGLFYIIIDGEVEVRTPSPVELDEESATPEGLLSFIVSFYHDIYWDKLNAGEKIQQLFLKELKRLEVKVWDEDYFDS